MFEIPKEELDKLENEAFTDLSDEHAEVEEEEEAPEEKVVEEKVSESTDEDSVADKARVPYSRFETVNERAIRAEERLKVLEEQLQSSGKAESSEETTPEEWLKMWGDNDEAREAWKLQEKLNERTRLETTTKILEDIEKRQIAKQQETEKNVEAITDNLLKFQETLGKKFTESEESAVLDIQDEWTPKDEKGNYITPLISVEKAYEIYTLRQVSAKADKIIARRKVVSITGSGNEGGSSDSAFESYRPGVGGLWRDKL